MLEKIKTCIRNNEICVLATMSDDGPHTSLMAYNCSHDCSMMFFVTSPHSRKYKNLTANPHVSILVDTRETDPRPKIRAITIFGKAYAIMDAAQKETIRAELSDRHRHLHEFMRQPDIVFIKVCIEAFQLLDGLQDAYYVRLPATET